MQHLEIDINGIKITARGDNPNDMLERAITSLQRLEECPQIPKRVVAKLAAELKKKPKAS